MKLLEKLWLELKYDKSLQMAAVGAGMIGVGFGFLHGIGLMGLVLFYRSWDK